MNARTLIIALFVAAALSNLNGLAMYALLPAIAEDLNTSVSVIGQSMTIAMLGGAVIGLIVGPLSDRFGHRRFVIVGMLLMSFSSAGTALAGSYEVLILVRFPAGIATGIISGIGVSIATTRLAAGARRSAIGWIGSGSAFGAVVGPPIMTALAELGGWRTGFWLLAAAPVLLAVSCLRVINRDAPAPDSGLKLLDTLSMYRDVFAVRRTMLLQTAVVFWAVPVMGGSAYFGAYLVQKHGFSLSGTGLAYMWAAIWLMVGPRVGVRLLNVVPIYPLIGLAGGSMAVTIMTVFLFPLGPPWILLVVMFWTLSMGFGTTLLTTAISEASPGRQGTALMLRQSCWTAGGAIGVAMGGVVIATGGYGLFGIVTGMSAIMVAAIAARAGRTTVIVPEPSARAGDD